MLFRLGPDNDQEGASPDVKCPKCGYTSFDDLEKCKKCGAALNPRSWSKGSGAVQPRLSEAIEPLAEEAEELEVDEAGEDLTPAEIAAHLAERAEAEGESFEDEAEDEERLAESDPEDHEIQLLEELDLDAEEEELDVSEPAAAAAEEPLEASEQETEASEYEPSAPELEEPPLEVPPFAPPIARSAPEADDETPQEASEVDASAAANLPDQDLEDEEEIPIPSGQLDWREELKLRVQRIKKKKEAKLRRMQAAEGRSAWPDRSNLATARQLPLAEPEEKEAEPAPAIQSQPRPQPEPREPLRIHHRTMPPPPPAAPEPARWTARYQPPPPDPAIRPDSPERFRPRRLRPQAEPGEPYETMVSPLEATDPPLYPQPPAADIPVPLLFESETGFDSDPDPTSIPDEMVRAASAMRTAGASKRFWAALYDFVFLFLINLAIVWGTGQVLGTTAFQVLKSSSWTLAPLLLLVNLGYFLFFTGASGETFGKLIMKLRVVSMDGGPCSFRQATFRTLGYLPSLTLAGLGFLWICWDDNDQGWHDKLAHTLVLDRN